MGDEGDPLVELFEEDVNLLDDALKSLELCGRDCVEEFVVEPCNDLKSGGNGGELGAEDAGQVFRRVFLEVDEGKLLGDRRMLGRSSDAFDELRLLDALDQRLLLWACVRLGGERVRRSWRARSGILWH